MRFIKIWSLVATVFGLAFVVAVPSNASEQFCCKPVASPGVSAADAATWWQQRYDSAHGLVSDGRNIVRGIKRLSASTDAVMAESEPAPPGEKPVEPVRYGQILTRYHQALAAYMAHRKAVQAHVSQFHQEAKVQKNLTASIDLPTLKPLQLKAQDECVALQLQEKELIAMEMRLRDTVEFLITQQGQMPPANFRNSLMSAETLAIQDRNAAMAFENTLTVKQNLADNSLHDKIHLSEDSGDFVQSQQVFSEVNRSEALIQSETQRAQLHMGLAQAFIGKLQILGSPKQDSSDSSQNASSDDSFENADAELDAEYQRVQQLYSLLQAAGPQPR